MRKAIFVAFDGTINIRKTKSTFKIWILVKSGRLFLLWRPFSLYYWLVQPFLQNVKKKLNADVYKRQQVLDKNGVAGRVGYKVVDDKKVRFNKKSGEILD